MSNNMNKGLSLLPWRDAVKGPILVDALLRLAVVLQIHLKPEGCKLSVTERWNLFTLELLKQPEFHQLECSRSI